jgi:hypothetical protein
LPPTLATAVGEFVRSGKTSLTPPAALALMALKPDVARSALRSGEASQKPMPVPLGPMLTAIRSPEPTLRWRLVPGASEYRVLIADQDGNELWQASAAAQTQMIVPAGVLQRGRVFFWQVEALVDGDRRLGPPVGFWLTDEDTERRVGETNRAYTGSALVRAAVYAEYGLYEDALTEVERLAQLNPASPEVLQMRNNLRTQLGQR